MNRVRFYKNKKKNNWTGKFSQFFVGNGMADDFGHPWGKRRLISAAKVK